MSGSAIGEHGNYYCDLVDKSFGVSDQSLTYTVVIDNKKYPYIGFKKTQIQKTYIIPCSFVRDKVNTNTENMVEGDSYLLAR